MLGIALSILFGLLPDFDMVIFLKYIIKGERSKLSGTTFKHHEFPTHFPLLYSPLIVVAIIIPHIYTLSMVTAVYLHFFMDTFYTSDGIKWLYPFNKKFYLLSSAKTGGKQGIYWEKEYQTTFFYKLEFIFLALSCFVVWWNHLFYYQMSTGSLILFGVLIIGFFIGALLVERLHRRYIIKLATEEEKN
jgi:hypothetical protein